jgi:hypothetical protein
MNIQMLRNLVLKVLFMILWFVYTAIFLVVMLLPHLFLRIIGKKGFIELEIREIRIDVHFRGVPYKEAIEED